MRAFLFTLLCSGFVYLPSGFAQTPSPRLHWTPRLGIHVVDNRDLVRLGDEWGGADGSATAGVALDVTSGIRWLSLRATVDRTMGSELVKDVLVGDEPCGTNCTRSVTREEPVAGFSMWTLGVDVLLHPFPSTWRVRPFAVAGTGLKHYRFDEAELEEREPLASRIHDPVDAAHHVGIGVDALLLGRIFRLEATDYISTRRFSYVTTDPADTPIGDFFMRSKEGLQHDLIFTIGLRMPMP